MTSTETLKFTGASSKKRDSHIIERLDKVGVSLLRSQSVAHSWQPGGCSTEAPFPRADFTIDPAPICP